jgi:hypothetical protein
VQLLATYEVALERTALDSARTLSKDPKLLRLTYDRVESLLPTMPRSEWIFAGVGERGRARSGKSVRGVRAFN